MFFRVSPHRSSNNRSIATPCLIAVSRLRAARSHNGHCGHAQRKTVNPTEEQHAESSESKNPTEILSARVQKNREPRTKNHHREPHWVTTTRSTGISAGRDRPGLFGSHSLRAPDPRYYILGLCAPMWPGFWSSINPPSSTHSIARNTKNPPSSERRKVRLFLPFSFYLFSPLRHSQPVDSTPTKVRTCRARLWKFSMEIFLPGQSPLLGRWTARWQLAAVIRVRPQHGT